MSKSLITPKKIVKTKKSKNYGVLVTLSAEDHKNASIVAKSSNETVAAWISSLVNTALMP